MLFVIVFYDFMFYNFSLFNNCNDLLKEVLIYLVNVFGKLIIMLEMVNYVLSSEDMVVMWLVDIKEGWWCYWLKGLVLLGYDFVELLK